jgi:hypothetical protein
MKYITVERILLAFIIAFILLCGLVVGEATVLREVQAAYVTQWQPPPIPHCEKELWLRIREGC